MGTTKAELGGKAAPTSVRLLIGTRKGLWTLASDAGRRTWSIKGPDFLGNIVLSWVTRVVGKRRVVFPIPPRYAKKDVMFLKFLMEQGKYRAVVDRTYPFSDIVEASAYVETGMKTGNVVLRVIEDD